MDRTWVKTNNTLPRYLFRLVSNDGEIVLKTSPLEWKDSALVIERRLDVGGVFVNYAIDSLTFIKEGAQFLKRLFNTYEINAQCDLLIYELNYDTRNYEQFPSSFSLNFNFYKVVKIGATDIQAGVNIKAVNSSEMSKFDNRKGTTVDLAGVSFNDSGKVTTKSVGGFEVLDWSLINGYDITAKELNFKEVKVINRAKLRNFVSLYADGTIKDRLTQGSPNAWRKLEKLRGANAYVILDTATLISDYSDVQLTKYSYANLNLSNATPVVKAAKFDYNFTLSYHYAVHIFDAHSRDYVHVYLVETDATGVTVINRTVLKSFGSKVARYDEKGETTFSVKAGNNFYFAIEIGGVDDIEAYGIIDYLELTQSVVASPERNVYGLPIYEALERSLQLILDKQFPLYSEFFGRVDTAYNLAGSRYTSEDVRRFIHVVSGLTLRGGKYMDKDIQIATSFDKLFGSINSVFNVGYMFENVGGWMRMRIERYDYFFKNEIALDISDRITDFDIESEVIPEIAYASITTGYKSYEYTEQNGRGEYNTTSNRTSIINTDSSFDNVSEVRADSKGIYDLLSKPLDTTGTTDAKGDSDLFFVKTQRVNNGGFGYKAELNELITVEDNTSLFKGDSLNLFLTPTRNLVRHGNKLRAGLSKYTSSVIRFQSSDKSQTLKTTGEGYTISENDDILVDFLDDPIYRPISHTVTVKLTFDERKTIIENPTKLIKFTSGLTGWLLKYRHKNAEDKVEITIIEKYVS